MNEDFDLAIRIARLEVRSDTQDKDIAELTAELVKLREEVQALRRFQAWLLGAAAVVGAMISQFSSVVAEKLK